VSIYAINLTTALGLALAIDYSLLMVSRFREELRRGQEPAPAVVRSVQTAGRTIVFSGATVVAALAVLLIFERGELRFRPAHPDAEHEPAAAELIDGGRHPRGQHRVAVRQQRHGRAEFDVFGLPGQPGQGGEGVVERGWVRGLDVGGERPAVGDHRDREARPLGEPGPVPQRIGSAARPEVEDVDA